VKLAIRPRAIAALRGVIQIQSARWIIDRTLVVVFGNDLEACEGKNALLQLDAEGSICVYAYAVLEKHADGTATVKIGDEYGVSALGWAHLLDVRIGRLGGRLGVALGARQALRPTAMPT